MEINIAYMIIVVVILAGAIIALLNIAVGQKKTIAKYMSENDKFMQNLMTTIQNFHKENKDDYTRAQDSQRQEIAEKIKDFNDSFNRGVGLLTENQKNQLASMEKVQGERLKSLEDMQREKLATLDKTQNKMVDDTNDKLEKMRQTVEEKLDKTLTDRIGKSFETVGKQLVDVQKGLGEMQTLAQDVGGLKKVLSNVKMRGGVGEVQLKMLLEQFLAPGQYEANVHTKEKGEVVEFAVKFPGTAGGTVWVPIDSKFPQDTYDHLIAAYESSDKDRVDAARKELSAVIKKNAKDIKDKYIEVPKTTKFGIMFLPFEGLYAEVARDNDLLNQVQREYDVMIAGPTNLAALLTSFQVGFQTLAIQKRGDEVWNILGAVKVEFGKFGDLLEKAKGKIQGGLNDIDTLVTTRTNVINRKLKDVSELDDHQSDDLLDK
ncbi:MAG: DNA recombination protein RmuC [Bacteroidales bacterium]|jgi:DNA recombination protein RmuC|nr:DNA recombination protein RmuC [Bacteroidales bacterium]MCI1733623.1 DNA recombination protein RmuC [Bacteroidales bacterium]